MDDKDPDENKTFLGYDETKESGEVLGVEDGQHMDVDQIPVAEESQFYSILRQSLFNYDELSKVILQSQKPLEQFLSIILKQYPYMENKLKQD